MGSEAERPGPLTRRDQNTGRMVVTAETAKIIAEQCATVAEVEKRHRRERRAEIVGTRTDN